MRRLYVQIYLAFLGIALLCIAFAAGLASLLWGDERGVPEPVRGVAEWVDASLPPEQDPGFQQALAGLADRLGIDLTLWDPAGHRLAAAGPPIPEDLSRCDDEGWIQLRGRGGFLVRLADGRCLAAVHRAGFERQQRHLAGLLVFPLLFGVVALGCYPVARRITARLEALQRSMDRFGRGELSARAPARGSDELGELARSFNDAASRVEALVLAQRRVLASASHELRSPLARLRVALALLEEDDADPERRALQDEATRDIEELDRLIGDILLGARLEARALTPRREPVDLRALLVEEATRVGATVLPGEGALSGDPALLRSMTRNLLENARRHGQGPVEAWVERSPQGLRLVVADRGPGVPEGERERIFEPFYRPPGHREGEGGVGLGLALVRWIAEAHGGGARAEAREGGGGRFVVDLPLEGHGEARG